MGRNLLESMCFWKQVGLPFLFIQENLLSSLLIVNRVEGNLIRWIWIWLPRRCNTGLGKKHTKARPVSTGQLQPHFTGGRKYRRSSPSNNGQEMPAACVQVKGDACASCQWGFLVRHMILLTAHVLPPNQMLDSSSSKGLVISMERMRLWKAILSYEVPICYVRLTSSGSCCTSRKISIAILSSLTLLLHVF